MSNQACNFTVPSKLFFSDFVELSKVNPMIRIKEEMVEDKKFFIISYMIGDSELWENPLSIECRGITFNEDGEIVCRPFEKFFNLNENKFSQENDINWNNSICYEEKRDGSMISPVIVNDKVYFKSKKSFYSDVAKAAQKNMTIQIHHFCLEMNKLNITPIFEYTDPNHRVVIDYGPKPEFTLLGLRFMESGLYVHNNYKEFEEYYGINVIKQHFRTFDKDYIKKQIQNLKEKEGFVLLFIGENGTIKRIKIKTAWYNSLHGLMTAITARNVAEAIIDETFDDMISLAVANGIDTVPLMNIESVVVKQLNTIYTGINSLKTLMNGMDRKEQGIKFNKEPMFSLAIKEIDGGVADVKRYWKKNFLPLFPTTPIFKITSEETNV